MRNISLHLAFLSIVTLSACSSDDTGGTDSNGTTGASAGTMSAGTTSGGATSAGTDGTTSGGGTESGSSGGGTSAGTTTGGGSGGGGMFCVEQCQGDADCLIDGADQGYKCVDKVCQSDGGVGGTCTGDAECVALFSGWAVACQDDSGCPGQVCIDVGGEGRCATPPSDFLMCETIGMTETDVMTFPGGQTVTVCANTGAECGDAGYCVDPCKSDDDCMNFPAGFQHCNVGTGVCGCASDAECVGVDNASVCVEGYCQCASDADCTASGYADVCYDGYCGCSSAAVCGEYPTVFDGTMVGCGL